MKTELLLVFMAGIVLSLFLIVSEVAAMRKHVKGIRTRMVNLFQSGKFMRLSLETLAITVFFLAQPVIVAFLVAMALDNLNPDFSSLVAQQLGDVIRK